MNLWPHGSAGLILSLEVLLMNVDEMIRGTQDAISVKRVYGDPIERDGLIVIPAAKVTGGGGGGGDGENNAGGGFGIRARPVGAYVIRDGKVSWEPALDLNRIILGGQIVAIFMFLALRAIFKRRK
jgi:uncharacterized spore protein YtfJ